MVVIQSLIPAVVCPVGGTCLRRPSGPTGHASACAKEGGIALERCPSGSKLQGRRGLLPLVLQSPVNIFRIKPADEKRPQLHLTVQLWVIGAVLAVGPSLPT
jgi:hypothetical protein